jgi:hypothetical protein
MLAGALVVAVARELAYALAGGAAAQRLAGQAGGTDPVWVALAGLIATAAAVTVGLWLVAVGVQERSRLDLERWAAPPGLSLRLVAVRATVLALATNTAFALVESCVHYHDGLGWMGLRCLEGPIHVDAAPILIALSLLAAVGVSAVDHVLGALRRGVASALLARPGRRRRPTAASWPALPGFCAQRSFDAHPTRGPPRARCPA